MTRVGMLWQLRGDVTEEAVSVARAYYLTKYGHEAGRTLVSPGQAIEGSPKVVPESGITKGCLLLEHPSETP